MQTHSEITAFNACDKKALDLCGSCAYYIAHRYIRDRYIMVGHRVEPESLLPLRPSVFHILLALSDGDLHGYGIMQEVAQHTDGQIKLGPGTLYGAIKRLVNDALIVEADERPDPQLDDERRRYYRLTDFGQRVLKAEVARISNMVAVAQRKRLIPKPRTQS
jgi:DNA-binding PadR family transcriptional regulator